MRNWNIHTYMYYLLHVHLQYKLWHTWSIVSLQLLSCFLLQLLFGLTVNLKGLLFKLTSAASRLRLASTQLVVDPNQCLVLLKLNIAQKVHVHVYTMYITSHYDAINRLRTDRLSNSHFP